MSYGDNLLRKYTATKVKSEHISKPPFSSHKRSLIALGLPLEFENTTKTTQGKIVVNNFGDIVVHYFVLDGKECEPNTTVHIFEANDKVLNDCNKKI